MQISLVALARGAILLWLLLCASTALAQADAPPVHWTSPASNGPSQRSLTDAPLSAGAWWAHGTLTLVPLGGVYGASRVRDERLWATGAQAGAGMLAGWLPSRLLFFRAQDAGPRWTEWSVATFGAGLVLTPPLAGLGTWAMGEWAFHGSRDRGAALLGAMGGAAVGTLLGAAVFGLLEYVTGPGPRLQAWRQSIALGFVGAGATAGYQWAGRGPRPR
ncbi:hypothetical protein [Hyalangium gracile]|uniref:hypothetical protein n=1 Tax=Hyalangium gracile TaxID=394092 RepID=UPI001CCD271A|nr:hypothetical protein [Hyalangium gracile]